MSSETALIRSCVGRLRQSRYSSAFMASKLVKMRMVLSMALRQPCLVYQSYGWNESASEKIGRYKETSTNATKMPMQIMMAGSTKLSIAVTRVETSSS